MDNKISFDDLFDFSDNADLQRAIQSIVAMEHVYKRMVQTLEQSNAKAGKATRSLTTAVKALDVQLRAMDVTTKEGTEATARAAQAVEQKAASYKMLKAQMERNSAETAKLKEQITVLTAAKKQLEAATRRAAKEENTAGKSAKIVAGSYLDLKDKLKQAELAYKNLGDGASKAVKQEALNKIRDLSTHVKQADAALRTARTGLQVASGSYHELRLEVNSLNAQLRNMPDAFGKNRVEVQRLQKAVYEKTEQLKKFDAAVNQNFRNVGNYTGGLARMRSGVLSIIGAYTGFAAVERGLRFAVTAHSAFEKSISSLKSITKATAEDVQFYTDEARRMGATTTQSAVEVVEAFTMIGGAKADLLENKEALSQVTEAAITLAEAGNVTVPQAAAALTASLNQFNLPVSETARIINTLAAGATAGAAEIPDLADTLDKMGSVAKDANIPIEQAVGLAELLSERNLKGAEAGTQLRNVILKLQAANIGYVNGQFNLATALDEVAAKEMNVTQMKKLFGLESITAGKAIVDNRDKLKELTEAVTGTEEAFIAAATNTDNFQGDLARLRGAVEGAVLEQDGFNKIMRDGVKGMTLFVNALRAAPDFIKDNWGLLVILTGALVIYNKAVIGATLAQLKELAVKKMNAVGNLGLAGTWRVLTAAMMANPFVAIAGLVIMLVGALVTLYQTSERVRATVAGMFAAFKEGFKEFKAVIVALMSGDVRLIAAAFSNMGKKSKKAYREGYNNKLKEDLEKDVADAVTAVNVNGEATATGEEIGDDIGDGVKDALKKKLKEAALELQKFRAESQADRLEEQATEDYKEGDPRRDAALRMAAAKRIEAASLEARKLLLDEELVADERIKINESAANEIDRISRELYKKLQAKPLDAADSVEKFIGKTKEDALKAIKEQGAEQDKEVEKWLEKYRLTKEREVELEKKAAEEKKAIRAAVEELGWQAYDLFFTMRQDSMERESQTLEKQKEADLKTAGDNEAAKQAIEEKYALEQAKLKQRQARMQKTQALIEIAINTAIAVSKAIGQSPITFGLPWSAFALASGAMQAAAVLSQPLPQYYTGTDDSKEGFAHVAERGPELVITPQGKLQYVERPAVMFLPAHSVVKTAAETEELLSGGNNVTARELTASYHSTQAELLQAQRTNTQQEDLGPYLHAINNSIAQQQHVHLSVDEHGFRLWQQRGAQWNELVNRKYKRK